jgi:imidazole glycerol-phosphate synthase subunit HisH
MKNICIIDYGLGNLASIFNAIKKIEKNVKVSNDIGDIKNSTHIILPGVGSYKAGMQGLIKGNLVEILSNEVLKKKKPFLGICLGMQLLSSSSDEGESISGLNWIEGNVVKINSDDKSVKIPHMGWNDVTISNNSKLYKKAENNSTFYFIHSYHFVPKDKTIISGTCEHGSQLVASIEKDNIFATQFHPEKSHDIGTELLMNFLKI